MKAYLKLVRAGLLSFIRDRQGVFWSFFFPLFFIFLFGSVFGRAGDRDMKFDIGLVVQDPSPAAAWVPQAFQRIPIFKTHVGALKAETDELLADHRRAVIVFPADFAAKMQAGETSDVKVYYNPAQQQTAQMVTGIVRQVIAGMDKTMTGSPTLLQTKEEPLTPQAGQGKQPRGIDFLLPGILAMTVMQLGLFTAIPLIQMREKGILKRLRATPLPRATIVSSQVTQRLVIGVVQTLVLVAIGIGVYKFHLMGSWAALLGLVVLGVLTFICIGAVLSSIAKTQESGVSLVQLVNMPMMFLSGLFFPLDLLPAAMKPVTHAIPATYLADALRHVMLATPSAFSLTTDLTVMGAWLVGSLLLAARIFRWE